MNDPEVASAERLVAALRANEPDALAALFDAYADHLFRYCWFLLRNQDIAQIALRDTLVAARADIGRLADPGALPSWLYALARAECRRPGLVPVPEADEPPSRPSHAEADPRLMAWHAVTSMDAAEVEALELTCRHDVEPGLVLGMSALDAQALISRARRALERAIGAEVLVSRGLACPDRAEVMRGWVGTVTAPLRERVLRHAASCPVCGPSVPRNVSPARVFALLPVVSLPSGVRAQVLGSAGIAAEMTEPGQPLGPRASSGDKKTAGPPRVRILAAAAVAAAAAAVMSMIVLGGPGGSLGPGRLNRAAVGSAATSAPRREGAGVVGALPAGPQPSRTAAAGPPVPRVAATARVTLAATLTTPLPAITQQGPPPGPPVPQSAPPVPPRVPGGPVSTPATIPAPKGSLTVSPGILNMAAGSHGEIVLTAEGRQQVWSASTSSGAISISGYGGTLRAGQSVTLVVVINQAGNAGSAFIYFDQGTAAAQAVRVFWSGRPPRPTPSPSSSPSPSASSGSPTPEPSASATPAPIRTGRRGVAEGAGTCLRSA